MDRLVRILRKPGAKGEIIGVASTQQLPCGKDGIQSQNVTGYTLKTKPRMLDRWLDVVVRVSGSDLVFFTILSGLLAWALLGIWYGTTDRWQVLISDIQAIISYLFDSFLVRQQLNGYEEEMTVAAELVSRIDSNKRMLETVHRRVLQEEQPRPARVVAEQGDMVEFCTEIPSETRFGRFITQFAHVLGHLVTVCLFWIGVFVWIGVGTLYQWSDMWQLYMNSASSALMVFTFAFLANIRERHAAYTRRCLDAIFKIDSMLESRLRLLTGDRLSNTLVVIPAPKVSKIQRAIFYYADVVGTLVGIAILMLVIAVWICTGPLFQFSSNWWLLIGTYAGLVGMNDGFVLRNMQARLRDYLDVEFAKIEAEDEKMFEIIHSPGPEKVSTNAKSLTYRVSDAMNKICAHELTVVAGFLTIVFLIAGASAMKWSLTGQLLCNVPPSLIESFFMIILITGHNSADDGKRAYLCNIYERRLRLLGFVNTVQSLQAQSNAEAQPEKIVG